MTRITRIAFLAAVTLFGAATIHAQAADRSAEQIIRRLEANETHETAYAEGRMLIHDRFGDRTTEFKSWSRGEDEALIEFTSPGEAGQKILRKDDQIYLFYPDAAELIRLKGSALRDSVMGSDMSYEDMTAGGGLLADYRVELVGTETLHGNEAYVIDLEAKTRDVPYAEQRVWIDAERYVGLKTEMYSRSGDLLKVMRTLELTEQAGKIFPVRLRIEDRLRSDTYTEFVFDEIQVDISIDPSRFSLEELTW